MRPDQPASKVVRPQTSRWESHTFPGFKVKGAAGMIVREPRGEMGKEMANQNNNETILIVDDRQDIVDFTRATLESQGLWVMSATNLEQAVAICEEDDIQVVLIDYRHCPDGGESAVASLRYPNPLTQVILHGGYGDPAPASLANSVDGPDSLLQWVEVGLTTYRKAAAAQAARQSSESDESATILFFGEQDSFPWLTSWLEQAGCKVLISPEPTQALDYYIRERAQIIILAHGLGDERTSDLVRRIRVLDAAAPVIALCQEDVEVRREVADSIQPHAICDGRDSDRVAEAIESALNTSWRMDRARADQDLRGLLLTKFSDDVRNAILAIQGYAEILREDSNTANRTVEGLSKAADGALDLVQKYLDLARLDSPGLVVRHESVSIDQLIADLRTSRQSKEPLDLSANITLSKRSMYTDGEKLSEVLSHLLENFVQATSSQQVALDIQEGPESAEFVLRNLGNGAPTPLGAPDSTEETSPNLSLAIARKLTDLLGGSLTIQHSSDGASVFRLSIPFAAEPQTTSESLH